MRLSQRLTRIAKTIPGVESEIKAQETNGAFEKVDLTFTAPSIVLKVV